MSEKIHEYVIRSESEAFDLLDRALKKQLGDDQFTLKFDNWPLIQIVLNGTGYESTITSDMAKALVEVQNAINRVYARAAHHATTSRNLTAEEKHQLQFKAKVGPGSSIIEINMGEFAGNLATGVISKMGPELTAISVIGIAIAAASTIMYKAFLRHRSDDKKIDAETEKSIALSQEETKRLEVFERAVRAIPTLDYARQDFDQARQEIVRGTADADSLTVGGVKIDRQSARIIAMTKRSESKDVQLNGNYFIRKVDWQNDGEVRITVGSAETARVFNATFRDDSLNHAQTSLLRDAEWHRSKIYLSINATELRGEVTTATIVDVIVQPSSIDVGMGGSGHQEQPPEQMRGEASE